MAKRRSRGGRSSGGEPGWKKSRGLMYILVGLIAFVWIYLLFIRGGTPDRPNIPQAYYDEETKELVVFDTPPKGYPPYENPKTGERTLWEAWTCTVCKNKDGEPIIFPKKFKLPEGVEPPLAGEEPSPEFMDAMMMADMEPPRCPKCRKPENTTRYMTPEAKKIIEEIRKEYEAKRKK